MAIPRRPATPSRVLAGLRSVLAWLVLWTACATHATPWPTQGWLRADPESQGVDSRALVALYEGLAAPGLRVDSLLLVRHGHIVSEAYFAPYEPDLLHDLRSVTKSVVGMLTGIALQRGTVASRDQAIVSYFPEHFGSAGTVDPRQRAITIDHLLEMRTGIDWREWPYDARSDVLRMAASGDATRYVLSRPMRSAPGQEFRYSGAAPQLLADLLRRATGQDLPAYAREVLFAPLGIGTSRWRTDARGHAVGESGLSLRPRDLARIGYLMLRDGVWDGRRLLPAGWLAFDPGRARTHNLPPRSGLPPRYSALWWIDDRLPMAVASGRHGQYLVLLPRHDALVVMTAKTDDGEPEPLRLARWVDRYLLPALRDDSPLPPNPEARRQLAQAITRVTAEQPLPGGAPPTSVSDLVGLRFALQPNALGWTGLALERTASDRDRLLLFWHGAGLGDATQRLSLPLAHDRRYRRTDATPQDLLASRGAWQADGTLQIELQDLQGAVVTELRLRFSANEVELQVRNGDGMAVTTRGRRR